MREKDIAIVFDCGASNVRVIAIDKAGQILSSHSMPNEVDEDPHLKGGKIWDLDKLWDKLSASSKVVTQEIDLDRIAGITVTTFGVDGAFIQGNGELLYPVISWQCDRTEPIMRNIDKYIPLEELYKISGVYPYTFNTVNKMVWFKNNRPDVIEQSHQFLFMPSLLIYKLTGVMQNDATMLGTSMMGDLEEREVSEQIFSTLGINKNIFGSIAEPGDRIGEVNEIASKSTGIPINTPVFIAGHDTQFAIFGSGAQLNQPVLSSGTWEVLMTRSSSFDSSSTAMKNNLTTEADAIPGIYDIGQNWLGSGVLEWFSKFFYPEIEGERLYNKMIKEAEQELPGSGGIAVDPTFYEDGSSSNAGTIRGLTISTRRSQLYRAFLEGLSYRLREGLEALQMAGNFKAESIICVGGGSKNRLWNQLRADVCNIPIQLIDQKETTVLGASMFVFAGAGVYNSVEEVREKINYNPQLIYPSASSKVYNQLYQEYLNFKK
ncbi:MAG TPA: L-fuculokinase [Marinilabiliaceae bacterium]|nr:L-fuculokinase [Marinilabiliaceae bacterium]